MKQLYLFNGRTHTTEAFKPTNPQDVKIYCCGPNIYDLPHLGHAKTFVFFDVLQRILRHYLGYGTRTVMTISDLDGTLTESDVRIAQHHEDLFFKTMEQLNITRPDFTPRVSETLDMALHVSNRCYYGKKAYVKQDIVYFDTKKYLMKYSDEFPQTRLRGQLRRVLPRTYIKNRKDFVLWEHVKEWIDSKGETRKGVPSQHSACTAIADFYFPDTIDIHMNGTGSMAPHHGNEMAYIHHIESCQKSWIRFSLHTSRVENDEPDMHYADPVFIDSLVTEGYSPMVIRYMLMKKPYGKPMEFNKRYLDDCKNSYDQLIENLRVIKTILTEQKTEESEADFKKWYDGYGMIADTIHFNKFKQKIDRYLMDNMNIPMALEELEKFVLKCPGETFDWGWFAFKYVLWLADTCFGLLTSEDSVQLSSEPVPDIRSLEPV